jgi:hypothetical protein
LVTPNAGREVTNGTAGRAGGVTPPPPDAAECEACREMKKDYPTGLGPMYGDPENNYGKFDIVLTAQAHHRALSESNAKVGEALDLLNWYVEWHRDELGVDTPGDYPKGDWLKCVEALLSRAKDGRARKP